MKELISLAIKYQPVENPMAALLVKMEALISFQEYRSCQALLNQALRVHEVSSDVNNVNDVNDVEAIAEFGDVEVVGAKKKRKEGTEDLVGK